MFARTTSDRDLGSMLFASADIKWRILKTSSLCVLTPKCNREHQKSPMRDGAAPVGAA